jgi:hypothetical protein
LLCLFLIKRTKIEKKCKIYKKKEEKEVEEEEEEKATVKGKGKTKYRCGGSWRKIMATTAR